MKGHSSASGFTAITTGAGPVIGGVYALHALSLLIGVTTAATVVGAFVFGVPSIIAVFINYLKKDEARGTFLESHFRWQIRTFWFSLLWCMIAAVLFITTSKPISFLARRNVQELAGFNAAQPVLIHEYGCRILQAVFNQSFSCFSGNVPVI